MARSIRMSSLISKSIVEDCVPSDSTVPEITKQNVVKDEIKKESDLPTSKKQNASLKGAPKKLPKGKKFDKLSNYIPVNVKRSTTAEQREKPEINNDFDKDQLEEREWDGTPDSKHVVSEGLKELSPQTLGKYVDRATSDLGYSSYQTGREFGKDQPKSRSHGKRALKRAKGIRGATSKLATPSLKELSPKKLGNYINKATDHATDSAFWGGAEYHSTNNPIHLEPSKETKRKRGIKTATQNLVKKATPKVDELSPNTLRNYVNKSAQDVGTTGYRKGYRTGRSMTDPKFNSKSSDLDTKLGKRLAGIGRATRKLSSESEKLMNELSPETLGNYVKKATRNHAKNSFDQGNLTGKRAHPSMVLQRGKKFAKRLKGIDTAVDKLSTPPLKELSPNTLKNYVKSADVDRASRAYVHGIKTGQNKDNKLSAWAPKEFNRQKGIRTALDKLSTPSLKELSPKTLSSYMDRSKDDAIQATHKMQTRNLMAEPRHTQRFIKRIKGMNTASGKIKNQQLQ